ncbi:M20 family metallopeptidase [Virgibacillus flavescens]|uniref:M20 family metallopeptidase n=1 Tax=Virgibacillus flavescens TaxID=1611422 RepID=UPI003D348DFC
MDAVPFLQNVIRHDSSNPPGNEHTIANLFAERCESSGIPYRVSRIADNRSNFEIELPGEGDETLLFCGHMDTVLPGEQPWLYAPHSGKLDGNKLYGRGASDMKSGLCAMFLAVESLFKEKKRLPMNIKFLATAGEEVDSCGALHYLQNQGLDNVKAIVIGEPTNEKVVVGHKGALWLEIVTIGKTAHGSMPANGINAVEWMKLVLEMIETLKSEWKIAASPLGASSLAVTKINGGVQTNVIPDRCSLHVDIRSIPPQSHEQLLEKIKHRLSEIFSNDQSPAFQVKMLLNRPSILTDKSSSIITTALDLKEQESTYGVSYYTDGAVLNPESKIPTLIYGPGDEKLAHQPNEYVDVHAYLRSIDFYKNLAINFTALS